MKQRTQCEDGSPCWRVGIRPYLSHGSRWTVYMRSDIRIAANGASGISLMSVGVEIQEIGDSGCFGNK